MADWVAAFTFTGSEEDFKRILDLLRAQAGVNVASVSAPAPSPADKRAGLSQKTLDTPVVMELPQHYREGQAGEDTKQLLERYGITTVASLAGVNCFSFLRLEQGLGQYDWPLKVAVVTFMIEHWLSFADLDPSDIFKYPVEALGFTTRQNNQLIRAGLQWLDLLAYLSPAVYTQLRLSAPVSEAALREADRLGIRLKVV